MTREAHAVSVEAVVRATSRASELSRAALARAQDTTHGALDADLASRERRRDEGYRVARSRMLSGQVDSARELAPALQTASHEAAHEGARSLVAFGRTVPNAQELATRVAQRMQEAQANTLGRLAAEHGRIVERTLSRANASRLSPREAAALVNDALREQQWRVERIAITEASYAFNAGRQEVLAEWGRTERGLWKRWTEKITDLGRPMDAKVAMDSVVMHAQLARPEGKFVMPEDNRVDGKRWGYEWEFPPNRPYDRAILTPWTRGSRAPGWVWRGGRRVPM